MDDSVTDEGRRTSILKPRSRFPLQEVQSFFPDDDTVTSTLTKSRRVSFGRNVVKEFLVGSAASTRAVHEYEQSSESISEQSDCSGPLDLALNKTNALSELPLPPGAVDSKPRDPEQRARLFTENCINIAKSVFQDTDTELTAIIIGAKPAMEEKNSSCMSFTNMDMSFVSENHKGNQVDFVPVRHPDMMYDRDPNHKVDKSRFEFLDHSMACATSAVKNCRPGQRTPLAQLPPAAFWEGENGENIPPAHGASYVAHAEPTMEFTCADMRGSQCQIIHRNLSNPVTTAESDMEETCLKPISGFEQSMDMAWEADDDDEDPLRLDGTRDDFLTDLSNLEGNGVDDLSDGSLTGIQKELANLSEINQSFRERVLTLPGLQNFCIDVSRCEDPATRNDKMDVEASHGTSEIDTEVSIELIHSAELPLNQTVACEKDNTLSMPAVFRSEMNMEQTVEDENDKSLCHPEIIQTSTEPHVQTEDNTDMEVTCANHLGKLEKSMIMTWEANTVEDPLRVDTSRDAFLSDLSALEGNDISPNISLSELPKNLTNPNDCQVMDHSGSNSLIKVNNKILKDVMTESNSEDNTVSGGVLDQVTPLPSAVFREPNNQREVSGDITEGSASFDMLPECTKEATFDSETYPVVRYSGNADRVTVTTPFVEPVCSLIADNLHRKVSFNNETLQPDLSITVPTLSVPIMDDYSSVAIDLEQIKATDYGEDEQIGDHLGKEISEREDSVKPDGGSTSDNMDEYIAFGSDGDLASRTPTKIVKKLRMDALDPLSQQRTAELSWKKLKALLEEQAQEKSSTWKLCFFKQSTLQVEFPLLETGLLLNISFNADDSSLPLTQVDCSHRNATKYQLPEKVQINDLGYSTLSSYITNQQKKLRQLKEVPYLLDFINYLTVKLKGTMEDALVVYRGCAACKVSGSTLSLRLHSYQYLASCWVDINLKELLLSGQPRLQFRHEIGRLDEAPVRNLLQQVESPLLQNFVRACYAHIDKLERKTGYITRRPGLLF